ncbi:hypothetical protein [Lentibacter sp. XHP0401]|uniref:hypothetical protein n=1 Tax=Lentibacter sp. XHP0401 TaxID=2984334 RepID=UPI0021E9606A|nr:hypothetical protein [Lentibacter sp. XHP0401]MCV2894989.1 hypothetical protein [Lentibacter sp. XHP0401]
MVKTLIDCGRMPGLAECAKPDHFRTMRTIERPGFRSRAGDNLKGEWAFDAFQTVTETGEIDRLVLDKDTLKIRMKSLLRDGVDPSFGRFRHQNRQGFRVEMVGARKAQQGSQNTIIAF